MTRLKSHLSIVAPFAVALAALSSCTMLMPTKAWAAGPTTIHKSGYWETYWQPQNDDPSKIICGMKTTWQRGGMLIVKHIAGQEQLIVHLLKNGWQFPVGENVKVPLIVGVDKTHWLTANATGSTRTHMSQTFPVVEFTIGTDLFTEFMQEFGNANALWIKFEQGNEPPWVANMAGSREASVAFSKCIVVVNEKLKATQPYASSPTQPYQSRPPVQTQPPAQTQPFAANPPQPKQRPAVQKKDDNSI